VKVSGSLSTINGKPPAAEWTNDEYSLTSDIFVLSGNTKQFTADRSAQRLTVR